MTLAETVAAQKDMAEGHRLWPFTDSWAAELGLSACEAVTRARTGPGAEREAGNERENRH